MARARNIKPSFFKNEQLVELPFEARLLFIGLWTLADREGRLEDRPKRIKMELFPADNVDVEKQLQALVKMGFITRYVVSGCQYIAIDNFTKHQTPHIKEQASTIPAPDISDANTVAAPPDSLIPSLLNPEDVSGKAPDAPSPVRTNPMRQSAIEVLTFLNEKAKRNYKPVDANIDPLLARFKEGFTPTVARQVVAKKVREWGTDEKMEQYLRPATLFNKTNFANYAGEIVP